MSLVNYYKCDVCDKELKQSELMRFKRERKDIRECFSHWMGHYKVKDYEIIDFDMCEKCFARIVKEIKGVE
jgi:hypothetical protein